MSGTFRTEWKLIRTLDSPRQNHSPASVPRFYITFKPPIQDTLYSIEARSQTPCAVDFDDHHLAWLSDVAAPFGELEKAG